MKKLTVLFAVLATLGTNAAFAQPATTGKGAAAARTNGSNAFAWGITLGAVAVVGTVVGIVAASASSNSSSFSH
ncbi:MAG TPA: hypothetical protein VGM34_03445 [Chlamydiales bacterium]|jgi:hypothetical protein